jgi:hypothetical protein
LTNISRLVLLPTYLPPIQYNSTIYENRKQTEKPLEAAIETKETTQIVYGIIFVVGIMSLIVIIASCISK